MRGLSLISFLLISILTGCAPPLDTGPMHPSIATIQELSAQDGLQRNVQVSNVVVPEEFKTSGVGTIDSATLKSVLIDTLYSAGYAVNDKLLAASSPTDNTVGAMYTFDAALKELSTPAFGFDLDTKCVIAYKLTRIDDGQVLLDETVTQGYLATFGQAFVAVERARISQSHAIGENVTQLLRILNRIEIEEQKPAHTNRRGQT